MRRLALLLALLAACTKPGPGNEKGRGTIDGWVCLGPYGTASTAALATAQAAGESHSTLTGADGSFHIDGVPAGEVAVVVTNRVVQELHRVTLSDGGSASIGAACATVTASLSAQLCEDGSLLPEIATPVTLTYIEFGGAAAAPQIVATDNSGAAQFASLVPGHYRLSVGGMPDTLLELTPSTPATWIDPGCFDPASVGSVTGRLCNPMDGTPVGDVPVSLSIAGEPERNTTTDDQGRFRFDNVPPGTHTLTIEPPLQPPTDVAVTVRAGETSVVSTPCENPDAGEVTGVVCNVPGGSAVAGANVRLEGGGEPARFATSSASGYFRFIEVPAGAYDLTESVPPAAPRLVQITVLAGEETRVPSSECDAAQFGRVTGRVCNPADQSPMDGVAVELLLAGESSPRHAFTDGDGRFVFELVVPGQHEITVRPPLQSPVSASVTVTAGAETALPAPTCGSGSVPNPATLSGTACVGLTSTHPLPGAAVRVDFNPGIVSSTAGLDGRFSISGLPAGSPTVTLSSGSWSTTFQVTLVQNQTLDIGTTHCVGASTRVAVVTGPYDDLVAPLSALGLPVRKDTSGAIIDANGIVDLIDGAMPNNTWVDDFAASLSNLRAYDIIVLSSGLNLQRMFETDPCGLPPRNTPSCMSMPGVVALENLEAYLNGGGAVYLSDWAYDIVRRQFPQYINFYDNDYIRLRALCGHAPVAASTTVVDEALAFFLGSGTTTIDYEDGYEFWSVIASVNAQPNSYLKTFLAASVPAYTYVNVTDPYCTASANPPLVTNSPLLVATPVGTGGGRLVFSTFRYSNAGSNAAIIQQVLLQL